MPSPKNKHPAGKIQIHPKVDDFAIVCWFCSTAWIVHVEQVSFIWGGPLEGFPTVRKNIKRKIWSNGGNPVKLGEESNSSSVLKSQVELFVFVLHMESKI